MERFANPSHLHDSNTSNPSSNWSSATLPPNLRSQQHYQQQYHHQQQQQQHSRSRSNSGRDALLNTSTDSANWRSGVNDMSPSLNASYNNTSASHNINSHTSFVHPSQQHLQTHGASQQHHIHTGSQQHIPTPNTQHQQQIQTHSIQQQQHNSQQQQQHIPVNPSFCSNSNNLNTIFSGLSTSSLGGINTTTAATGVMEHKKEVNHMDWFHGNITRDQAETLLQPRQDGLFLVRESTNFPGDYTLCVCYKDKVEHYRVYYKDERLTIDDDEYFEHLTSLIEHYKKEADGLCTHLVRALPRIETYYEEKEQEFKDKGLVLNTEDLKIGDSIGKGEFGDVMLGDHHGKKVAVKRLKDTTKAAKQLLDEASLMISLLHENLVQLIGLVFEESSVLLVTEYMSKGSLVDYLRSRGRQHITNRDQIMFACDTAAGMEYLETKQVVHRDLAARNVLISHDAVAKVCDFGMAESSQVNKSDGVKFPIKWTAPEALKHNIFSNKSDMWSFGILLWEIYSFGRVPYPKIPLNDVRKHVEKGYRMDAPDNCPTDVYRMMEEAWHENRHERPNFKEVHHRLQHIKSSTPA